MKMIVCNWVKLQVCIIKNSFSFLKYENNWGVGMFLVVCFSRSPAADLSCSASLLLFSLLVEGCAHGRGDVEMGHNSLLSKCRT